MIPLHDRTCVKRPAFVKSNVFSLHTRERGKRMKGWAERGWIVLVLEKNLAGSNYYCPLPASPCALRAYLSLAGYTLDKQRP